MKRVIYKLAFILLAIVIFLALIILCGVFIESVLLPSDYLFYENSPLASMLIAPLLLIPSIFVSYCIIFYLNKKITSQEDDFLNIMWFWKTIRKCKVLLVVAWIIATYSTFTSLAYVTDNSVVVVSPLNLEGKSYHYYDIEKVETGFGSKKIALYEYEKEGNFYYKVTVEGEEIVFHMTTPNPNIERYEDSYLEIEEFDKALRKINIPKESKSDGYEECDFDQIYVDRFLRIISTD